jgi:hypothetical protein
MIVGEHHAGAVETDGVADDGADGNVDLLLRAGVAAEVDAAGFVVEVGDPQAFGRPARELGTKKARLASTPVSATGVSAR